MTDSTIRSPVDLPERLLSHLPGMLYQCRNDSRWTMLYVSQGSLKLTGYPPEALIGNRDLGYADIIHPEDRETVWQQVAAAVVRRSGFELEYRILSANGEERWVWEHGHALDDEGRELFGFVLDVTERKRVETLEDAARRVVQESLESADRARLALLSVLEDERAIESALRERESRYRALVDSMSDGVAVYTAVDGGEDFVFREYNTASEQIGGIPREQVLGRSVREVFPGVEKLGLFDVFKRVWRNGRPERHPVSLYQDDRISLWVENHVFRIPSGEIVAIYQDVTRRKQTELALRASEEKYRLLVDHQTDLVVKVDAEGRFEFVSPSYCRLFGMSEAELLGQTFFPLVHEDDREDTAKAMEALQAPPHTVYLEQRAMTTQGWRWLGWMDNAMVDAEGRVASIIGVGRDITERKLAEQALRESEERYRGLVEDASQLICCFLPSGEITFVNSAYCAYFGKTPEQLVGADFRSLIPEADRDGVMASIASLTQQRPWRSQEHRVLVPGEQIRWQRWTNRALFDASGEIRFYQAVGEDITDRKQAEEAIQQQNVELERRVRERTGALETANRELESFVYSVSHDLRAPLRAVNGFAQILARRHRDSMNGEGRHYLDNVVDAGAHMGTLIDDLLEYSRTGRGAVRCHPVPLGPVIAGLQATFGERIAATGARIDAREPLATPLGDPTLIGQILNNLLDNALIYHRDGEAPEIAIASERHGDWIRLSVLDRGIGIDPRYHEKIFKVFQRLHDQDTYPGTGIGLAIVAKAAQLMRGEVRVDSTPGLGSCFTLTLPAAVESLPGGQAREAMDPHALTRSLK